MQKTIARDQKCSKIVLKWKIRYSPILRQLQQLVLHILDPFMVFSKLIMIRNRTEITILILDLYLDPFSLTQNEPFLMKTHFWHFRLDEFFWNFRMKFLGWNFWDENEMKNFPWQVLQFCSRQYCWHIRGQ